MSIYPHKYPPYKGTATGIPYTDVGTETHMAMERETRALGYKKVPASKL